MSKQQLTPAKVKRMQDEQQKQQELQQAVNERLQKWMEETQYPIPEGQGLLIEQALKKAIRKLVPKTLGCDYEVFKSLLTPKELYTYFEMGRIIGAITGATPETLGELYIPACDLCFDMAKEWNASIKDRVAKIEAALIPVKPAKKTGAVKDAQNIADGKA